MRLDSIIRIIDNEEYVAIKKYKMTIFKWLDIDLHNGDLIRIEKVAMYDEIPNKYKLAYFTFELDTAVNHWVGEYGTNMYYILSNIYNETDKKYKNKK